MLEFNSYELLCMTFSELSEEDKKEAEKILFDYLNECFTNVDTVHDEIMNVLNYSTPGYNNFNDIYYILDTAEHVECK